MSALINVPVLPQYQADQGKINLPGLLFPKIESNVCLEATLLLLLFIYLVLKHSFQGVDNYIITLIIFKINFPTSHLLAAVYNQ